MRIHLWSFALRALRDISPRRVRADEYRTLHARIQKQRRELARLEAAAAKHEYGRKVDQELVEYYREILDRNVPDWQMIEAIRGMSLNHRMGAYISNIQHGELNGL